MCLYWFQLRPLSMVFSLLQVILRAYVRSRRYSLSLFITITDENCVCLCWCLPVCLRVCFAAYFLIMVIHCWSSVHVVFFDVTILARAGPRFASLPLSLSLPLFFSASAIYPQTSFKSRVGPPLPSIIVADTPPIRCYFKLFIRWKRSTLLL